MEPKIDRVIAAMEKLTKDTIKPEEREVVTEFIISFADLVKYLPEGI